jgi:hypothetical protein
MRLFELIDSDEQLLGLIKPILLRAKAEGADTVSTQELVNDLDSEDDVTPEKLVDTLNRHRNSLGDIITRATVDEIVLARPGQEAMTTKYDQDVNKMKNTALKQAMDQLK